jgi:two-component system OmpR family response regulator
VRALSRRSSGTARLIECGSLTFDQTDRCALVNGDMLDLSARELGCSRFFCCAAKRLVSKDQLVDHLCGWGEEVSHNAIEVYIHRLRKKLEATGVNITTVRGLGYYLEKPAEETKS